MRNRFERRNRHMFSDSDADPMAGVSNLADVMLVLAVGIMLALIMNWHISVSGGSVTQMDKGSMKEIDQSQLQTQQRDSKKASKESNLQKKGTVYVDKKNGKMYLIEPGNND